MHHFVSTRRATTLLAWTAALLAAAAPAAAQDFYDRKQINLVVGVEAGPGYDAYARFVARHIAPTALLAAATAPNCFAVTPNCTPISIRPFALL